MLDFMEGLPYSATLIIHQDYLLAVDALLILLLDCKELKYIMDHQITILSIPS